MPAPLSAPSVPWSQEKPVTDGNGYYHGLSGAGNQHLFPCAEGGGCIVIKIS